MLGRTLIAQQRFADARDVLTEAAKHPQDDGTAWSLLGSANALLGRWDESLAAFDEAIRRKPTDAGMMGEVALALIRGGKLVEGESMLRRAAEVESNAPQVLLAWGVLAMERADRTKASDYFRQVLNIDPTNDAALQYLSLISPVGQPKA
jgi:cytochrome c-type biogenesis protein CcmH